MIIKKVQKSQNFLSCEFSDISGPIFEFWSIFWHFWTQFPTFFNLSQYSDTFRPNSWRFPTSFPLSDIFWQFLTYLDPVGQFRNLVNFLTLWVNFAWVSYFCLFVIIQLYPERMRLSVIFRPNSDIFTYDLIFWHFWTHFWHNYAWVRFMTFFYLFLTFSRMHEISDILTHILNLSYFCLFVIIQLDPERMGLSRWKFGTSISSTSMKVVPKFCSIPNGGKTTLDSIQNWILLFLSLKIWTFLLIQSKLIE